MGAQYTHATDEDRHSKERSSLTGSKDHQANSLKARIILSFFLVQLKFCYLFVLSIVNSLIVRICASNVGTCYTIYTGKPFTRQNLKFWAASV